MAVGDVIEVIARWENVGNNDAYINSLHWVVNTDDLLFENEKKVCIAVNAAILANVLPQLTNTIRFRGCVAQRVRPLPRTTGWYVDNGDMAVGGIADEMLPPSCAMVVRKRTAFAGRKFRGRLFQVGLGEGDQQNGVWSGARYVALQAAWDTLLTILLTPLGGGEYSPCLWDKTQGGDSFTVITTTYSDNIVRSQRRREPGRGS